MFTPSSTARIAAGPLGATSGTRTSVAGKLLTTLASTAATAAMPSSAKSPQPAGINARMRVARPLTMTACTTTPSASTNTKNGTLTARAISTTEVRRWLRLRTASAEAPASAAQAGDTPAASAIANPANVSATTTSANSGSCGGGPTSWRSGTTRKSAAKNQRKTTYTVATATTHGSAITIVNLTKDRCATWKASRLVRFETGSSSEAALARCALA